jgi:hypothetical protein
MRTHLVVLSKSPVGAVLGGVGASGISMESLLLVDGTGLFPWANVGSNL